MHVSGSEHLKIQDVAFMGIWFHENDAMNCALEENTQATADEEVMGLSSEKQKVSPTKFSTIW